MKPAHPLLVVVDSAASARDPESVRIAVDVLRAAERVKIVTPRCHDELDRMLAHHARGRTVVIGADSALRAVVASLRRDGALAGSTVGLVPVGGHERHARGCCVAGTLGLPASVPAAARLARGPGRRWLSLLVDADGEIAVGRVRVGLPAVRRPGLPRPGHAGEPLPIPGQQTEAGLRLRLTHAGALARAGISAGISAGLSGLAVAAAASTAHWGGWRLVVEADGVQVCAGDGRVVGVELGASASTPTGSGAALADVVVTTVGRGRLGAVPHQLRTLRASTLAVRGSDVPVAVDDLAATLVRQAAWRVEPAAVRVAAPA